MAIDIIGSIKDAIDMVINLIIAFCKFPLMIWFNHVPYIARVMTEIVIILLAIFMIYWTIKNRYEWMRVYNT